MDKDYLIRGRALDMKGSPEIGARKVGKADWPHGVGFPDYFYKYMEEADKC